MLISKNKRFHQFFIFYINHQNKKFCRFENFYNECRPIWKVKVGLFTYSFEYENNSIICFILKTSWKLISKHKLFLDWKLAYTHIEFTHPIINKWSLTQKISFHKIQNFHI
jgi:hypothetical protein